MERAVSAPPLRELVRADIEAATHPNFKLYGPVQYWTRVLGISP